ncbi:T9SS type A sorting domain-containing protein [Wandonia haliotis]
MKKLLLLSCSSIVSVGLMAQFNLTPQNWTIPVVEDYAQSLDQVNSTNYSLIDMNGDGKPDMVDAQDNASGVVWLTGGSVPYWKVYLNTGSGFSSTAQNWTIPVVEDYAQSLDQVNSTNYSLIDMNGDGKPDLVDAQDNASGVVWLTGGSVPYWKVYLNTGSGFSSTAQNWTIPVVEDYAQSLDQVNSTNYSLIDMNGDGKPDMVDAQDNASGVVWLTGGSVPYWKVYLNTGSGFNSSAESWTIPVVEDYAQSLDQVNSTNYSLVDMNGDGKPDMVDAQDNASGVVWLTGGSVPYWKVYLNTGSGFSSTAQNWTIPVVEDYAQSLDQVNSTNYSLIDMNGDNKPDMVDAQDNASGVVWLTGGSVPYWKVYLNTGSGFNSSAESWTVPVVEDYAQSLDQVNSTNYSVIDMNGDNKPDMVDAQDNASGVVWLTGGSVPYWKVYLNESETPSYAGLDEESGLGKSLVVYPNPTSGVVRLNLEHFEGDNQIRIVDGLGRVVLEEMISGGGIHKVDLGEFETGIYFVSVLNENKSYTSRVIKK